MIPRIVERISSLLSSIEQPPLFRDPKYAPDIKRIGSSPGAIDRVNAKTRLAIVIPGADSPNRELGHVQLASLTSSNTGALRTSSLLR
jgi:hypothetical protein